MFELNFWREADHEENGTVFHAAGWAPGGT
jgi:hypothetical protein